MICTASRAPKQSTKIVISLVRRHPSKPVQVITTGQQPKLSSGGTDLPTKPSRNDPTLEQNKRNNSPVCSIHQNLSPSWADYIQKASWIKSDKFSKNISESKKLVTTVVVSKRKVGAVNPLKLAHDCAHKHVPTHLKIAFNSPTAAETGTRHGYC